MKVWDKFFNKEITIKISKYRIEWDKAPSKEQQILQDFLYKYWKNHIILSEMRVPRCLWRFDLVNCNKRIIIEYSPESHHNNFNKFFHKNRAGYLRSLKSDLYKYEWAEKNGFKIIEIVKKDLDKLSVEYIEEISGVNIL